MISWGLIKQIWILSYIILYGKLKSAIAKIYVNANHISNTTICSFT